MAELVHPLSITEGEQEDYGSIDDQLPKKVKYLCHPCLLTYSDEQHYDIEYCDICEKRTKDNTYRCKPCNFSIHYECSLLPSRMESQGKQIFHHFTHHHPLMIVEIKDDAYKCFACKESSCSGQPHLVCCMDHCSFSLHDSCFNLPQEIRLPFHHHPLTLISQDASRRRDRSHYYICKGCGNGYGNAIGFGFHCEECRFVVDIKCAFLRSTIDEARDEILYSGHIHPLTIIQRKHDDDHPSLCTLCHDPCFGVVYSCDPCRFYLHPSCKEMAVTLQHFYHPHLLSLHHKKYDQSCSVCENCVTGFFYGCDDCDFRIDIDCALLPSKMESQGQQQFHHFGHGHPLKLAEREHDDDEIKCSACQKCCSGDQTYICCKENCKFSLHDSCFNLCQKIRHPFHPDHPLTLNRNGYEPSITCRVCCHESHGFTYNCSPCKFKLDVECPVALSTISYQIHFHNLLFIENVGPGIDKYEIKCHACLNIIRSSTSIFRCVECYFYLHLECGPLPLTIQHESHMDPLTLTDSPAVIDGEHKLDTDVFYCDACEEERDPRLPVYYCSDGCAYLAELKCVIPKVMSSLRGECGEVELRSPIKHIAGKVISKGIVVKGIDIEEAARHERETVRNDKEAGKVRINHPDFDSFIRSFTAEDHKELHSIRNDPYKDLEYWNSIKLTEKYFLFTDKAYDRFMKSLDSMQYREHSGYSYYEKIVNIGDHWVPWSLAPMLEILCSKYGDISAESTVKSSKVKMCLIVDFCGTLNSMYSTRVLDVSEDLLFSWWTNLKTLQFAGFQVHFAFDRLKGIADAYFGLTLKTKKKQDLENIDAEITKVSLEIEDLKAKLEALKERRKSKDDQSTESGNSSKVSECLKKASTLKWMIAGDGMLW